jgi:ubiquinone biosynthesis monooxygenase Coq7
VAAPAEAGRDIAAMIRVDHAGEFGALRICAGQLAVLARDAKATKNVGAIRKMAEQEQRHFETFDRMIKERAVRPTLFEPIWHVAGYALGAATALMGEKAAMACTVAVEDVIDAHYAGQIAKLADNKSEAALKRTVEEFRDDEIEHRDEALARGAEEAPAYSLLAAAIRAGCRVAISLSERL